MKTVGKFILGLLAGIIFGMFLAWLGQATNMAISPVWVVIGMIVLTVFTLTLYQFRKIDPEDDVIEGSEHDRRRELPGDDDLT